MNDLKTALIEANKHIETLVLTRSSFGKVEAVSTYYEVYSSHGQQNSILFLVRWNDGSATWMSPKKIESVWAHKFDKWGV